MSKYTTEVRFICETKAGFSDSQGNTKVDEIIDKSWNKIFDNKFEIFDEAYRSVLCQKILRHYYTREISAETVGLWELWLNTKMREIMPYYNKLYKSELLEFNPLYDVDITRKRKGEMQGVKNDKGSETQSNSSSLTENTNGVSRNLYAETPQGGIIGLEDGTYLTNATKIMSDTTNNGETSSNGNRETENGSVSNTTEEYLETVVGKQGTTDYSTLLLKYRQTFVNIDMMIIDELENLFFQLW